MDHPVILLPQNIICICEFQMQNSLIGFFCYSLSRSDILKKSLTEYYVSVHALD